MLYFYVIHFCDVGEQPHTTESSNIPHQSQTETTESVSSVFYKNEFKIKLLLLPDFEE